MCTCRPADRKQASGAGEGLIQGYTRTFKVWNKQRNLTFSSWMDMPRSGFTALTVSNPWGTGSQRSSDGCSPQNNNTSATFLLRFFLLHAALKSEYPSEIHTGEKQAFFCVFFKLPPQVNWAEPAVPELATELNAVPSSHKSRRSSYLEMKLLTRLERSAASPAVTHPLHTHTHTYIGRSYVPGTGGIVSMGASYGQLYFYF